jgi:hypothetical protein
VVLRFRSSHLNVTRALANFGIGPLVLRFRGSNHNRGINQPRPERSTHAQTSLRSLRRLDRGARISKDGWNRSTGLRKSVTAVRRSASGASVFLCGSALVRAFIGAPEAPAAPVKFFLQIGLGLLRTNGEQKGLEWPLPGELSPVLPVSMYNRSRHFEQTKPTGKV